jgi:small subunit ribosomal protein S14
MKHLFIKDNARRANFEKKEKERLVLKFLLQNNNLEIANRIILTKKLENVSKNASVVRLRNRCAITYRGRGVNQKFKLSRNRLRELFFLGLVPGYKKSVW